MLGNRVAKSNSMFVKLLLSMTAIAVITVVLIATATYTISADNSIQNAIGYNESILNQQQELIDKELTAIKNAANGMVMTQSYLYHTIGGKLSVSSLIDLTGFVEDQKKISPYIDSIYMYYAPLELVLTSRPEVKTSPVSTFADRSWLDEWSRESASRTVWLIGRPNGFAPEHPAASLLQKTPLIGRVEGAVVINLKLDLLFADYLSHYHSKKGTTLVIGSNRELLYSDASGGEDLLARVNMDRLVSGKGSFVDDSSRIVTYTTSELTGWRFVEITERSVLLGGMNRIKFIVLAVALTYITAAFAISFYLSRRLYRPLQNVISYIVGSENTEGTSDPPPRGDEAGFIRHSFEQLARNRESLLKEKRRVEELLAGNRTAIKEKYLNDLIQGAGPYSSPDAGAEAAELLGLRLDFGRFAVLTLELEEPYPLKGPDDTFHFHLFHYGLMEELEARIDGEIFAKDGKRTVILLSVPLEAEEHYPLEQAKELKQLLLARYGMSVTIAVSRIHSGEASVRTAYGDTLEALNLKIYIGKGEILTYAILNSWKSDEEEAYDYPYNLEKKLLQALLQTDQEECFAVVRQITRTVIDQKLGKANIQQLFFQLAGEIVKTLVQTGGEMSAVFGSRPAYADALARAETLPDMEACLIDMCGRIIAYHREKRSRMSDVTLRLATEYMDTHYNKNISVDTVAEHVQRSSSYLGRIFKESTGMTVNDYLIQLRIKRAMELLKQPGASVEEICREIGYANVSYFNKVFKARTGLTPGQYRHQQAADQLLSQGKGPTS